MKSFYITTAIDYVNSTPHIGTAFEKIAADVIARYKRLCGCRTFFMMGADEHSINVERQAHSLSLDPLEYCNRMENVFTTIWKALDISYDYYIRTTSHAHHRSVQEIFNRVYKNGDVYKGKYRGYYCESCEAYIKSSELVDGNCPNHRRPPKWIEEENYFFRLSKYQQKILNHIEKNPDFIQPPSRKTEIIKFIEGGLEDISISRAGGRWGVPVPVDKSQVIYVWFDALINYITGVGFPDDMQRFDDHWPADIHVIGKDITRFHCVIWPAMLMSAGLPLPKVVFGHGFVYIGGRKMSKTTGTLVDPLEIVKKAGTDSLRYFLMREIAFERDGDFYPEKFVMRHNSELANDLGNLVMRTTSMVKKYQDGFVKKSQQTHPKDGELTQKLTQLADVSGGFIEKLEFHNALSSIWERIRLVNAYIDQTAPWGLYKSGENERLSNVLKNCLEAIKIIAINLYPFIPSSCEKIWRAIGLEQKVPLSKINIEIAKNMDFIPENTEVVAGEPIFPRIKCL